MIEIQDKKDHYRIPLLKDHHNHLSVYALLLDCLNLQEITKKEEALELLRALDKQSVSVVLGWKSGFYHFSEAELALLPPVIIVNISLHEIVMTPSAETRLCETYPEIIANYRDPQWFEDHMPQMLALLACLVEPTEEKYSIFFQRLHELGVYYVEEMQLPAEKMFYILQHSPYANRTSYWTTPDIFKTLSPEVAAHIKGLKYFTDGAVGARTAALEKPFLNGAVGKLLHKDEVLFEALKDASKAGKAAAIHAIGDVATAQVVRVIKQLKTEGYHFPLLRMEHCQFITKQTAVEAKQLGMVLSMQPNFSVDSTMYSDRLPQVYLEANNPFRMLIDEAGFVPGQDLIFGSDGMPHGVEAALNAALFPPYGQQKLNLDEFVFAYCMPDFSTGSVHFSISGNIVRLLGCD